MSHTDLTGNGLTNGEEDFAAGDITRDITLWDETVSLRWNVNGPMTGPVRKV